MKVMLINGSPDEKGCTYTALSEVAAVLNKQGIETQIFWIGSQPLAGCSGCGYCRSSGQCVYDDSVNQFKDLAKDADGFVFGCAVHYAAATGAMTSFMDRVFYSGSSMFYLKPAACVVTARRAGTTAALEQLNKYPAISQMPIVTSQYWNMAFGNTPQEVKQDEEGMQIMRTLGSNMAWFLKCIQAGKKANVEQPEKEKRCHTNFIRNLDK